jgi:hypothetical protein
LLFSQAIRELWCLSAVDRKEKGLFFLRGDFFEVFREPQLACIEQNGLPLGRHGFVLPAIRFFYLE